MKRSTVNVYTAAVIILAAVTWMTPVFMFSGCGKKAPPEPPSGSRPPKVVDLGYSISENVIKLSWTIPKTSDMAKSTVTGFFIYGSKQLEVEADCPNCPIYFLKIGDVLVRRGNSGQPELTVEYTQSIEPGYRYIYKVKAYDDNGVAGRDSNVVDFRY